MMKNEKINRRSFLKKIGSATAASALAASGLAAEPNEPGKKDDEQFPQIPQRPLGKTASMVSALGLGTNRLDGPLILQAAFRRGVRLWDTGYSYVGGNSELSIGKFLEKNPQHRKDIFIATKASGAKTIEDIEQRLRSSLERMKTDYIDLYHAVHGLSEPDQLTDELKNWAESARKKGLIRYVGFSTHKNIPWNLYAAVQCGWIDAVITSYNFRLMADAELQKAIDECHKKGVGLIAMKTVALDLRERKRLEAGEDIHSRQDKDIIAKLLEKGLTIEQAGIKAVLEDERIACACVGMGSVNEVNINSVAALDTEKLSSSDRNLLNRCAKANCSGYCAGCAHICDSALPEVSYVSDIMRYLMYYNSYGDRQRARELFAQIPIDVRKRLLNADYSLAEARCPQHLPIKRLINEAVEKLTLS
jgi:aryl-alcohol dehydrogenase-like predicted oxidoreductase